MGKYDDIISLPHHESTKHPKMPALDRAVQFLPFAALTGHDAAKGNGTSDRQTGGTGRSQEGGSGCTSAAAQGTACAKAAGKHYLFCS